MSKKSFGNLFATRGLLCYFLMMLLFLFCVLRVTVIATSSYGELQEAQSLYTVEVSRPRGTIYDCNMVPITNNECRYVAAVLPSDNAIESVIQYADINTLTSLKNKLPAICEVPDNFTADGTATTAIYTTNNENRIACHIIGYTDSSGHGVSGLELAYDSLLYSDQKTTANFTTDGKGRALCGISPYFENDLSVISDGVVTTLDIEMQRLTESAISGLNSGCAVVAEVKTGKIRAMASVPTFDVDNIYKSLNEENSPLLNRALAAYNVGSVFKPCIAASAIENRQQNKTLNCIGSLEIDGRKFRCHKYGGHGEMNLCTALAESCNCYFYDMAISMGSEKIYKTAASLSINGKINIANNLSASIGVLPSVDMLASDSAIANFSIGQGTLTASPIAVLNLYLAIAGDGSYYLPSIVEKTILNGKENIYDIGHKTQVMQSNTAAIIREYLITVITDGTGDEAAPTLCTAAGKTATAQTGRYYDDGTEITNSWFCGFFPAENPQYAVVVMSDSLSNVSTASIFAEIADRITELNNQL